MPVASGLLIHHYPQQVAEDSESMGHPDEKSRAESTDRLPVSEASPTGPKLPISLLFTNLLYSTLLNTTQLMSSLALSTSNTDTLTLLHPIHSWLKILTFK